MQLTKHYENYCKTWVVLIVLPVWSQSVFLIWKITVYDSLEANSLKQNSQVSSALLLSDFSFQADQFTKTWSELEIHLLKEIRTLKLFQESFL